MTDPVPAAGRVSLAWIAAATAVVLSMIAAAGAVYLLLDVVMLLFLGVVVAAALQPWHLVLCRLGVPKGAAVLLIYLLMLVLVALVVVIVGPVVVEQFSRFVTDLPADYARGRTALVESGRPLLRLLGQGLPPFASLAAALSGFGPQVYEGTVGFTTGIVKLPAWIVTVLALAFYWTMEIPRLERLFLSMIDVERRPRALETWHEIESRLGGFLRGQGLAMLTVGAASAVAYAAIGLPNVFALGLLAGVLEAVPWIGPMLAVVPAVIVALPLGTPTVLLVMGAAVLLQSLESNVLLPRIMTRAVGVSPLVSLLAILAFGTLYGLLGVLLAIPLAAVVQVLLDTFVVNAAPHDAPATENEGPWDGLRARVAALKQQARRRLRARTDRFTLDARPDDAGSDAVDGRIEAAVGRVEDLIAMARENDEPAGLAAGFDIATRIEGATVRLEEAGKNGAEGEGLADASDRFTDAVREAEALVPAGSRPG